MNVITKAVISILLLFSFAYNAIPVTLPSGMDSVSWFASMYQKMDV